MERQGFDDQWKKAFEDAEVSPSEMVWTNIAHDLEKAGNVNRKLWFYKLVAAASIFFALAAGATGFYLFQQNEMLVSRQEQMDAQRIADVKQMQQLTAMYQATVASRQSDAVETPHEIESSALTHRTTRSRTERSSAQYKMNQPSVQYVQNSNDANTTKQTAEVSQSQSPDQLVITGDANPSVAERAIESSMQAFSPSNAYKDDEKENSANQDEVVAQLLEKLQQRENELRDAESKNKRVSTHENVWSSIGFAAGSFNTRGNSGISPTSQNQALYARDVASHETSLEAKECVISYSVGFSFVKNRATRWVVQSGINYLRQSSNYTAETAFGNAQYQEFKPESINEYGKLNQGFMANSDTRIVKTAPYTVNNNVRYLSVPVQAGYLIINTRLGLQVNAGVSTDLFLQNTKSANGENVQKIDQEIGDDDVPYKTMNFSGLLGSELSYRFGSRYRLALNPGLRYPFSSIYKSGLGVKSAPLTVDLGLRFRYIFQ